MRPFVAGALTVITLTLLIPVIAADALRQNERLGRGVNIIGWDALWQDRARGIFKDEHFKLIHEAGFSHVRINLHPLRDGKPDARATCARSFSHPRLGSGSGARQQAAGDSRLSR